MEITCWFHGHVAMKRVIFSRNYRIGFAMADSHGHLCNNYCDGIEKQKICETKGQEILDPRLGVRLECCVGYIANRVPLCLYHSRLQACGEVPNWR